MIIFLNSPFDLAFWSFLLIAFSNFEEMGRSGDKTSNVYAVALCSALSSSSKAKFIEPVISKSIFCPCKILFTLRDSYRRVPSNGAYPKAFFFLEDVLLLIFFVAFISTGEELYMSLLAVSTLSPSSLSHKSLS